MTKTPAHKGSGSKGVTGRPENGGVWGGSRRDQRAATTETSDADTGATALRSGLRTPLGTCSRTLWGLGVQAEPVLASGG